MSHLDHDVLADLALDPDSATHAQRQHLASCPDCVSVVGALFDVRRLTGVEPLVPPPARVRALVLEEVRGGRPAATGPVAPAATAAAVVVPVPERRPRRIPAWAAGLAAVATLVVGVGVGRLSAADPAPEAPATTVVAATDLTALDSDAARGRAEAVRSDGAITLRVSARDLGGGAGFREVWLINLDGARMVSVGVLADGGDGEFQVPRGLLDDGYRIVDISVEPDDGDPTHSGVSLARGELA
jgi:hypothetical protein